MHGQEKLSQTEGGKQFSLPDVVAIFLGALLIIPVSIQMFHDPVFGGNFWLDRGALLVQYLVALFLIILSLLSLRKKVIQISLSAAILMNLPRLIDSLGSEEFVFAYTAAILFAMYGLSMVSIKKPSRKLYSYLSLAWLPILVEIVWVLFFIALVVGVTASGGEFVI